MYRVYSFNYTRNFLIFVDEGAFTAVDSNLSKFAPVVACANAARGFDLSFKNSTFFH